MKIVEESLYEFMGAGFSLSRVGATRTPGVGGGNYSGFADGGYSYSIMPLNRTLQPAPNEVSKTELLHIGMTIQGKSLNNKTNHTGKLINIIKNDSGNVNFYVIVDEDTAKPIKINPSTVRICKTYDGKSTIYDDRTGFQSTNPIVYESLNKFIK